MKQVKRATKSKLVVIRMSQGMYQQVMEQANKKHMGLQEYIRYLVTRDIEKLSEYYES
jgi:predicted DNA binding CopG/RHH family protein